MEIWKPESDSLKWYPHFDTYVSPEDASDLARDPQRVASHSFFPLIKYVKTWQPFRTSVTRGKLKERPIRYAARRDAYIYAYYRRLLSERYEAKLIELGIQHCPVAYRKIPVSAGSHAGKCNIHFAKNAFDDVVRIGNCVAVALDISKFFESIDHNILKDVWCSLLEVDWLPEDHFSVFRSVTRYAFVDRDELYRRLGFLVEKTVGVKTVEVYTKPFDQMPLQLCDGPTFREMVAGQNGAYPKLIETNDDDFGIPQGTPISDLLANMYLIDFDVRMNEYALARGGSYYRYSDDIMLVLPGGEGVGRDAERFAQIEISRAGPRLVIKREKTAMVCFSSGAEGLKYSIPSGYQNKNGLEYLGFRFDGSNVYLRDSTLANLHRKIAKALYHQCISHVKRYRDRGLDELIQTFNLNAFHEKFSRVEDFERYADEKRNWTFWTYARKATQIFGLRGRSIYAQLRNNRAHVERTLGEKMRIAKERA